MPTLTIDLELPEAEYQFASSLTREERHRVASIAMTAAFATARNVPPTEDWDDATPFTQEEIDALADAVAQEDAGLSSDGEAFFAKLDKQHGWNPKP